MGTRFVKGQSLWRIFIVLCLVVSTLWVGAVPTAAAPVPTITGVSPSTGPVSGGTVVTISGNGLGGGVGTCTFNGVSATNITNPNSPSGPPWYICTTPASSTAGYATIIITNSGGTATNSTFFTYVASTPPTITGISPNTGPITGGISVIITGTNLSGATAVKFGTDNATSYTVNSTTQITAISPAHAAGTVDVTVTTTGGTSATSSTDLFTYVVPLAPTVTVISRTSGSTLGGTSVTITGTNFTWVTAVKFGTLNATSYTVNSATQITATSPAGTGTVHVTVTTAGGISTISSADQFTYVVPLPPTVTGILPANGPTNGGTSVTITGTNLTGTTGVSFGSTGAFTYTVNSDTQITAASPAGSGTVDVTVTTPGGTSTTSSVDQFSYTFTTRYAYGWGNNSFGQLGNGTTTDSSTPLQMSAFSSVISLTGGGLHSLALKSDGTVATWGYNFDGELGNGTTSNSSTPVQLSGLSGVTAIAGGELFSLALKQDQTVWAWGFGGEGEMGNGTTSSSSTPVQVSGLTGVTAIAAGEGHGLARKDNKVYAWGDNWAGQLGNGATINSPAPVQVSGLTDVTAIAGGWYHSLALKSDGTVWAWGNNSAGQLGNGIPSYSSTPVQVSDLTGVTAIAAGAMYSMALKSDGTVRAWGSNNYGQLGNGATSASSIPVQVSGLTGVAAIAAGSGHSLALKSNGTVWGWGYGGNGQLGNGATSNKLTPVQVTGISAVNSISAGGFHSLALISPAPTVRSISPSSGSEAGGTTVTVTGTSFYGGGSSSAVSEVKFGTTVATSYSVISDTSLTAVSPGGSGVVDVTVTTTPGGISTTSSTDRFTYVVAEADVNITVTLQGSGRPDAGWVVPLTVKFFAPGTDVLAGAPLHNFDLITTKSGSFAVATASGITPGIYDISAVTPHCLTNVKQGVVIAASSTDVDLGTLLEGNADDSNIVNITDFGILASVYGKSSGDSGYNAQADFDCSGIVNITDFGLLAANYGKSAPVVVP